MLIVLETPTALKALPQWVGNLFFMFDLKIIKYFCDFRVVFVQISEDLENTLKRSNELMFHDLQSVHNLIEKGWFFIDSDNLFLLDNKRTLVLEFLHVKNTVFVIYFIVVLDMKLY